MDSTNYIEVIEPELNVGIVDADLLDNGTRHPNLALMKISAYCKSRRCSVTLLESYSNTWNYDLVFVSRVFTFTKVPSDLQARKNVIVGGTGFFSDGGRDLPYEIEHIKPDYDLYNSYVMKQIDRGRPRSWFADYLDYSIGFTSRGCFRKCSFCVNKKYSRAFRHASVVEFLDESRPRIYLWDDNVFACSEWESIFDELAATKKPFQFRQGLDIRLLTKRKAKKLARAKYAGDYIFAFDHIEDRNIIEKHLKIWRTYSDKGTRLYVLCAFDSQDEHDIESTLERIKILMHYGCLPYIMRFESYKKSPWRSLYVNLARWCNQPQFFKKKSFRQFCEANQACHKTIGTLCSAMKAMSEFESAFPEIAEKYFDLRFEEENMMMRYGRAFYGRPSRDVELIQQESWQKMRGGALQKQEVLRLYFLKSLDIAWLEKFSPGDCCSLSEALFDILCESPVEDCFEAVCDIEGREAITSANIPQFSNIDEMANVAKALVGYGEWLSYEDLGKCLSPSEKKKKGAYTKYGENHGKLAALLDLACVEFKDARRGCQSTLFSDLFLTLDISVQRELLAKLSFRVPIVANMLRDAVKGPVSASDYLLILSESTKNRRLPNVMRLIALIDEFACPQSELYTALRNVGR